MKYLPVPSFLANYHSLSPYFSIKSEYQNTSAFDFFFFKILSGIENVTLSRIALRYYRDFDGSVSSNVRYVTCSHGTDCTAESPAGRVQCFKMAKIDPVSTFYPTL